MERQDPPLLVVEYHWHWHDEGNILHSLPMLLLKQNVLESQPQLDYIRVKYPKSGIPSKTSARSVLDLICCSLSSFTQSLSTLLHLTGLRLHDRHPNEPKAPGNGN